MEKKYILSVDQSTQGTKALLFDKDGSLLSRTDLPHEQMINEEGWVSHDLTEIYQNTVQVVKDLVKKTGIDKGEIAGLGISNQRETSAVWDRTTGSPVMNAIVWQCARAKEICERVKQQGSSELIFNRTGLQLSPYFPASKFAWILENVPGAKERQANGELMFGTIDTWLVYKLTGGKSYKTDYSNASRTQLFNLQTLVWDEEVCALFGLKPAELATVCDSNGEFGETDLDGYFDMPVPIRGVLGDSHGALFGQGCLEKGMIKCTYGTGSSIMMNIGSMPILSKYGVVTSLAWGIDGKVNYVLEGNINYTGAVISWLKDDLGLVASAGETEELAKQANPADTTYLVPAFTGLGAPYWDSEAKANISGITRVTGRAEIARAALDAIVYQITDVLEAMKKDTGIEIEELRADGGPTRNSYLMQFQSDISCVSVRVPAAEELSGIGVAYMAGVALRIYDETIFSKIQGEKYKPGMGEERREEKYSGWKEAVKLVLK